MRILIIALFLCVASSASAVPVLDQIYFDPADGPGTAFGFPSTLSGEFRRAQTFTVGIAGPLNSVDMRGLPGSSMRILSTSGGTPTFTVLASTNSFVVGTDGWIVWDLSSSNLIVTPGEILAMDMLQAGTEGVIIGGWDGRAPGGYPRGADYFLNVIQGIPNFTLNPDNTDFFLRTFVGLGPRDIPLPSIVGEPAPILLMLLGMVALLLAESHRRQFRI